MTRGPRKKDHISKQASVLIRITEDIPPCGNHAVFVRVTGSDLKAINKAAKLLDLKQSEYSRVVLVNAANKIIADME